MTPEKGQEVGRDQRRLLRRLVDSKTQTEEPTYETPAAVASWSSHSPTCTLPLIPSSTSTPICAPSLVADSRLSHHCRLGRSQSLRGKRREGRREGGERGEREGRGGSLRLSSHQANRLLERERLGCNEESVRRGEQRLGRVLPGNDDDGEVGSKGGKREPEVDGIHGRKLERKNSLLSRLFGRKKSGDEEAASAAVLEDERKEIRVFSAQFPPPDINIPKVVHKYIKSQIRSVLLKLILMFDPAP